MCLSVLPVYMYVRQLCTLCPRGQQRTSNTLEPETQGVMCCHLSAEDWTELLRKSDKGSQLQSQLFSPALRLWFSVAEYVKSVMDNWLRDNISFSHESFKFPSLKIQQYHLYIHYTFIIFNIYSIYFCLGNLIILANSEKIIPLDCIGALLTI